VLESRKTEDGEVADKRERSLDRKFFFLSCCSRSSSSFLSFAAGVQRCTSSTSAAKHSCTGLRGSGDHSGRSNGVSIGQGLRSASRDRHALNVPRVYTYVNRNSLHGVWLSRDPMQPLPLPLPTILNFLTSLSNQLLASDPLEQRASLCEARLTVRHSLSFNTSIASLAHVFCLARSASYYGLILSWMHRTFVCVCMRL
jgi:hypothetical protein